MTEKTVDKDLEHYLASDLSATTRKEAPVIENEIKVDDEEEDEGAPCSNAQQNEILDLLTAMTSEQIPQKHFDMMRTVTGLSSMQAEVIIKTLERCKTRNFSKRMTKTAIETLLVNMFMVEDKKDIDDISADEFLTDELGTWIIRLFDKLGPWKGPLLFLYYGVVARIKKNNDVKRRTSEKKYYDEAPLPTHGRGKVSNGEEHSTVKADDLLLGQDVRQDCHILPHVLQGPHLEDSGRVPGKAG